MLIFIAAEFATNYHGTIVSVSLIAEDNGKVADSINISYHKGGLFATAGGVPKYKAMAEIICFCEKNKGMLVTFAPYNEAIETFFADYKSDLPKDRIIYISSLFANKMANKAEVSIEKYNLAEIAAHCGIDIPKVANPSMGDLNHKNNTLQRLIYHSLQSL